MEFTKLRYVRYKLGICGMEVFPIKSQYYFKQLCNNLKKQKNQSVFIVEFFNAAGSTHFQKNYKNTTADNESARSLLKKGKALSKDMKGSFPVPFKTAELANYIEDNLLVEKIPELLKSFDIPSNKPIHAKILSLAIAEQFKLLVESAEDEVKSIVFEKYQNGLDAPFSEVDSPDIYIVNKPYYEEDSADVLNQGHKNYDLPMYHKFTHEWIIRNTGSRNWLNRKLVFINSEDTRIKAEKNLLEIPSIQPGKDVSLKVILDTRGFEGTFRTKWEMQDEEGNNCFPNLKWIFDVKITVSFIPGDGLNGK